MHYRKVLGLFLLIVLTKAFVAEAHWDMEPRFWADESKETFYLRIHNGAHANRSPVKKELNVCFWIEELSGSSHRAVSEKNCSIVILKPDEWLDFVFDVKKAAIQEDAKNLGKLRKGSYRAVAMAREQKGALARFLFGAALERLYSYFEVQ